MSASLETVLVSVWQQVFIDKKKTVDLGDIYPVRQTSKSKLKQIDFHFEARELRGLEQNPNTKALKALDVLDDPPSIIPFAFRG